MTRVIRLATYMSSTRAITRGDYSIEALCSYQQHCMGKPKLVKDRSVVL